MGFLHRLHQFLLSSTFGKTLLGPVITTGAAVLLSLPADPQPSPLLLGRINLMLLVVCGTGYGVKRSELERASSEARSRDVENRLRDLSSQRETNRLRQQNELRRQQLERFDRAFVVLRRKLRAQTWQPLPPLSAG